jgi:RHS repeat-associated protein
MRVLQSASETLSTRYFHTDHLGSISVITDENGVVVERLSYDAWGKRRFANGADDPTGSIASETTRGFTGEEELSVSGLVHLNGRVYDPLLARFTSADTITENPLSTQGWNRYSYVGNDPLAFTDPSGHCFLGCFWQHIGSAISSAVHAVTHFFATNSIAKAILQIASTILLNAIIPGSGILVGLAAAAGGAAIATGLSGGNLGQILKAAAIAGATAFAFDVVGSATNAAAGQGFDLSAQHIQPDFDSPGAYAVNVAGHALVGCASSAASGGSCESGALSGGVTAAAGPLINGQRFGVALVENAVIGGVASVAGGGKFANGAVTGAFGYLFNSQAGRLAGGIVGGIFGALLTGPEDAPLTWIGWHLGAALGDLLTGPDPVGCVYCVSGDKTSSGMPYIGRSDDFETREGYSGDGRDRTGAEIVDTYPLGDRAAARVAEQQAINSQGGVANLDNRRNEIAPKKMAELRSDRTLDSILFGRMRQPEDFNVESRLCSE